jgi:hypothetical protein
MNKTLTDYAVEPDGSTWPRDACNQREWETILLSDVTVIKEGTDIDVAVAELDAAKVPAHEFLDDCMK